MVDDLGARVANGKTLADHAKSRAARFTLYQDPVDSEVFSKWNSATKNTLGTFLDRLMAEIPGKPGFLLTNIANMWFTLRFSVNLSPFLINLGYTNKMS